MRSDVKKERTMASIFTKMMDGEMPAHFVWKDDVCVAFMTIAPLQPGHTLVVPRQEVDSWTDLEPDVMKHLIGVAHSVGLEVRHVHLHVTCIWKPTDLDFGNANGNASQESIIEAADLLRKTLRAQGHSEVVDS
jgi:histidine triad (HIT) family protein